MEKTPSNVNPFAKATVLDKYIWRALFWVFITAIVRTLFLIATECTKITKYRIACPVLCLLCSRSNYSRLMWQAIRSIVTAERL